MCFLGIYVILQLLGSLKSVPLKPELPVLDVVSLLQIDEHALFAQQQVLAASAYTNTLAWFPICYVPRSPPNSSMALRASCLPGDSSVITKSRRFDGAAHIMLTLLGA